MLVSLEAPRRVLVPYPRRRPALPRQQRPRPLMFCQMVLAARIIATTIAKDHNLVTAVVNTVIAGRRAIIAVRIVSPASEYVLSSKFPRALYLNSKRDMVLPFPETMQQILVIHNHATRRHGASNKFDRRRGWGGGEYKVLTVNSAGPLRVILYRVFQSSLFAKKQWYNQSKAFYSGIEMSPVKPATFCSLCTVVNSS